MGLLSSILETLKFKAVVYDKLVFTTDWGLNIRGVGSSHFWRVVKGSCFIKLPDEEMIKLEIGDLVFMPHGIPHWIASDERSVRVEAAEYVKARSSSNPMFIGVQEETQLIGGHFELDATSTHPFIKGLPNVIYLTKLNISPLNSWFEQTATLLFEEVTHEKPGGKLILSRLAEITFVQLIRAYIAQTKSKSGFLLALQDERISKALKLLHDFPEKEWTLNLLSLETGMSRSLFCRKFKEYVGETPLNYLTNWRVIRSKEILTVSTENIRDIAMKVGYQSEAAFNRIFKAKAGETPANFRRASKSK